MLLEQSQNLPKFKEQGHRLIHERKVREFEGIFNPPQTKLRTKSVHTGRKHNGLQSGFMFFTSGFRGEGITV